jgi:LysM repeat protein
MRHWTRRAGWWLVWQAAGLSALNGCEKSTRRDIVTVTDKIIAAGAGTAPRTPMMNVIPSKPASEIHAITVLDEHYLGDIARQLGVTVDGVLADNALTESTLKPGQVLKVRTTRDLVDAFEARRERRRVAKLAAEEAKRIAKAKVEAEARAARKAKQRAAKLARGHKGTKVVTAKVTGKAKVAGKPGTVVGTRH